jgi:perosamine synthetase
MKAGLQPVFADVDPDTLQITLKSLVATRTDATVAVFVEHHAGYPAPLDEILAWAKTRQLAVFDDASLCLPTVYKTWENGDWPTDITFFHIGGGGVACVRSSSLASACAKQRRVDVWSEAENEVQGYRAFLPEPKALELCNQLQSTLAAYARRNIIWGMYDRAFDAIDGLYPPWGDSKGITQSCMSYSIRLESTREHLAKNLTKRGIAIPRKIVPIYEMDLWTAAKPDLPVVEEYVTNQITLPIAGIDLVEAARVIEAVRKLA